MSYQSPGIFMSQIFEFRPDYDYQVHEPLEARKPNPSGESGIRVKTKASHRNSYDDPPWYSPAPIPEPVEPTLVPPANPETKIEERKSDCPDLEIYD